MKKYLNILYILSVCGTFFVSGYVLINFSFHNLTTFQLLTFFIAPTLYFLVSILSVVIDKTIRLLLQINIVALILSAYCTELYFVLQPASHHDTEIKETAAKLNLKMDERTRKEVIIEAQNNGVYLTFGRHKATDTNFPLVKNISVYPLAGQSNTLRLVCNEYGPWLTYLSDKHGFNNREAVWDKDQVKILALGDSYVEGYCSPNPKTIIGKILDNYPNTINLGIAGTGPLAQLATFIEYGQQLSPKIVIWFYSEYDLADLNYELKDKRLNQYLSSSFSAELINNQKIIDQFSIIERRRLLIRNKLTRVQHLKNFILLQKTNAAVNKSQSNIELRDILVSGLSKNLIVYKKIIKRVKKIVNSWDGHLVLVYLPAKSRYLDEARQYPGLKMRPHILQTWRNLGVKIVDLVPVFKNYNGEKSELVHNAVSHFSENGNALVANTVLSTLEKLK